MTDNTTRKEIRIGILGAGVVGQGILKILRDHAQSIEQRLGATIVVQGLLARDPKKKRTPELTQHRLTFEPSDLLDDPEVDIVVEVMGGVEEAGAHIRRALQNGKAVVTANKALLAEQGQQLFEIAESRPADLYFEAAVAGGIPVIRVLREALASDEVVALRGILNGTSNYILSRMTEAGLEFDQALKEAQDKGFAEADPTLDVGGGDAAHKLSILATLAFGAKVDPNAIATSGIGEVGQIDIRMARRFGYVIKPLAIAKPFPEEQKLQLRVQPALVPQTSMFATIGGALNAIALEGAMLGPCMLTGLGAGALPTAMSVVSDIVDVGRNLVSHSSGRVPHRAWLGKHLRDWQVAHPGARQGAFYLRFPVRDEPGTLGQIAQLLGAEGVSIQQMVQEPELGGGEIKAQIVMLTHLAEQSSVRRALSQIDQLSAVVERARCLAIEPD